MFDSLTLSIQRRQYKMTSFSDSDSKRDLNSSLNFQALMTSKWLYYPLFKVPPLFLSSVFFVDQDGQSSVFEHRTFFDFSSMDSVDSFLEI